MLSLHYDEAWAFHKLCRKVFIYANLYYASLKNFGKKNVRTIKKMLGQYFSGAVLWKAVATQIKMAHTIINLLVKLEEIKTQIRLHFILLSNQWNTITETQKNKTKQNNWCLTLWLNIKLYFSIMSMGRTYIQYQTTKFLPNKKRMVFCFSMQNNNITTLTDETFCKGNDTHYIRYNMLEVRLDGNPVILAQHPNSFICLRALPIGLYK